MRVTIGALILFLVPVAMVIGVKKYQEQEAVRALQQQAGGSWQRRGEVLFFNASWCGPCRQMRPVVATLRREGYHMRAIDVDRNKALTRKYRISSVPTFVFVENGQEVTRFSGGRPADELRRLCSDPAYRN